VIASPDGKWIAYNSNRAGPTDIYCKLASGAAEEEPILTGGALFKNLSAWSPDSRSLIFQQPDPHTGWDVWMVSVEGDHKPVPLMRSRFNEIYGDISPDMHWMSYISDESGRPELYVQSFPTPGNKYQVSRNGALFEMAAAFRDE